MNTELFGPTFPKNFELRQKILHLMGHLSLREDPPTKLGLYVEFPEFNMWLVLKREYWDSPLYNVRGLLVPQIQSLLFTHLSPPTRNSILIDRSRDNPKHIMSFHTTPFERS